MVEIEYNREIVIKFIAAQSEYVSDYLPDYKSTTLKRFAAYNDSSAGGAVRLGYRVAGSTFWISEVTLTAQDTLYGDDFNVHLPPNAQLVFNILSATDNDIIHIYIYGE